MAHIKSTFNSTIVSITDTQGGVVSWSSSGKQGFKGSRKGTFAAQMAAEDAAKQAIEYGMREVKSGSKDRVQAERRQYVLCRQQGLKLPSSKT